MNSSERLSPQDGGQLVFFAGVISEVEDDGLD